MKKLSLFHAGILPLLAAAAILMFSCVFDSPRDEDSPDETAELPLSGKLSIDDARAFFEGSFYTVDFGTAGTRGGELPEPAILFVLISEQARSGTAASIAIFPAAAIFSRSVIFSLSLTLTIKVSLPAIWVLSRMGSLLRTVFISLSPKTGGYTSNG